MTFLVLYPNGQEAEPCTECGTIMVWSEDAPRCFNCHPPRLVYCKHCHKTHSVVETDVECAPGAWIDNG